jgi:hypothetical protein
MLTNETYDWVQAAFEWSTLSKYLGKE